EKLDADHAVPRIRPPSCRGQNRHAVAALALELDRCTAKRDVLETVPRPPPPGSGEQLRRIAEPAQDTVAEPTRDLLHREGALHASAGTVVGGDRVVRKTRVAACKRVLHGKARPV